MTQVGLTLPDSNRGSTAEAQDPRKLSTSAEIAERLAVSTRTVQRLAKRGLLPVVHVTAKLIRFDPKRIDQWISESARRPRPHRSVGHRGRGMVLKTPCSVPGAEVQSPAVPCARSAKGGQS